MKTIDFNKILDFFDSDGIINNSMGTENGCTYAYGWHLDCEYPNLINNIDFDAIYYFNNGNINDSPQIVNIEQVKNHIKSYCDDIIDSFNRAKTNSVAYERFNFPLKDADLNVIRIWIYDYEG